MMNASRTRSFLFLHTHNSQALLWKQYFIFKGGITMKLAIELIDACCEGIKESFADSVIWIAIVYSILKSFSYVLKIITKD